MFVIIGRSKTDTTFEEIDSAETEDEAQYLVNEYQLAFGGDWEIDIVERS